MPLNKNSFHSKYNFYTFSVPEFDFTEFDSLNREQANVCFDLNQIQNRNLKKNRI